MFGELAATWQSPAKKSQSTKKHPTFSEGFGKSVTQLHKVLLNNTLILPKALSLGDNSK